MALEVFLKAKAGFQEVLAVNPENIYAMRMSSFNLNRVGKCYAALAEKNNRQEFLQKSLEHLRAALDNFNRLKSDGKLGEVDFEEVAKMEEELNKVEEKLNKG